MSALDLVKGKLPPELATHLAKLDAFEDMAKDIKAIRGLLERQEKRDLADRRTPRSA
jgi:hypothetical protein